MGFKFDTGKLADSFSKVTIADLNESIRVAAKEEAAKYVDRYRPSVSCSIAMYREQESAGRSPGQEKAVATI